jgi:cytochrome P450
MSFAQLEATAILAVLLQSLSLRLRPGYVPEPKLRVTLGPAAGMPVRVVRRPVPRSRCGGRELDRRVRDCAVK